MLKRRCYLATVLLFAVFPHYPAAQTAVSNTGKFPLPATSRNAVGVRRG
jgi:hypothetical protein